MGVKRKISIRKVLQVFLTLVVTTCCVIAMVSASRIEDNKMVKNVTIHFKNDKKYHFIQEQEIMDLAINHRNIDIKHTPVSKLDINSMEQVIMADPWVAGAQVFIDNELVLHMYVTQRIPVVRVFQQNGRSFYLDTTLSIMPLSANYIYYTTIVTNVPELKNDSTGAKLKSNIITLARKIQKDTFWNAQVSQVIVDSQGMFEFVPTLGDQRILFGDVSRMEEKFNNLFVFYKNVLNRIGWDKYQTLDVRFSSQVVATPSLPYTGPVDLKVKQMNWINSIIETEARNDAKDSIADLWQEPGQATVQVDSFVKMKLAPVVSQSVTNQNKSPAEPMHSNNQNSSEAVNDVNKPNVTPANNTDKKQKTPKYIYPAKNDH